MEPPRNAPDRRLAPLASSAWTLLVVAFYLPVVAGSLAYLHWTGGSFGLQIRTLGEEPTTGLLLGLGAALPVVLLTQWMTPRVPALRSLALGLGRMTGRMAWVTVVLIALVSSVAEELLFRGVIHEQLGAAVGIVLFAAAHVPFERELWLWPVFALGAGGLFAGLYEATGAVLAPITAHFVINALNLRWLSRRYGAGTSRDSATTPPAGPPPSPPSGPPRTADPTGG